MGREPGPVERFFSLRSTLRLERDKITASFDSPYRTMGMEAQLKSIFYEIYSVPVTLAFQQGRTADLLSARVDGRRPVSRKVTGRSLPEQLTLLPFLACPTLIQFRSLACSATRRRDCNSRREARA